MPDLLNYQPSRSAVFYTPPQRLDLKRTIVGFAIALVLIAIGSCAYGIMDTHLRSMFLRPAATIVAALAVGCLALIPVHYGRVRAPVIAGFIGAALSLFALYVMWIAWLHAVLVHFGADSAKAWIFDPLMQERLIHRLNRTGTFAFTNDFRSTPVNGVTLTIIWIAEATLILVAGILIPTFRHFHSDPMCLQCGRRCTPVRSLPRFAAGAPDDEESTAFVTSIENRDFTALMPRPAAAHEDDPELSLRLLVCKSCGQTNVLSVNHIAWYIDRRTNRRTVKTKPLINQLLISPEESKQLQELGAQIREQREQREPPEQREESAEPPTADPSPGTPGEAG